MKNNIRQSLDNLHLSDIYSLMLFILYKVQDIPEYTVLSELCYLLDGPGLTRLFAYFAGKTITFPTEEEFAKLINALLLYQYVNIDRISLTDAQCKLTNVTVKQKDEITKLYLKILPILNEYNFDRSQFQHGN